MTAQRSGLDSRTANPGERSIGEAMHDFANGLSDIEVRISDRHDWHAGT